MKEKKAAALLGLATKAGKTISGEDMVLQSIKSHKAKAVIVSTEASDRTKKKLSDKCAFYRVPYIEWGTKQELGLHLGKSVRTAAAVVDAGLGKGIAELFREEG